MRVLASSSGVAREHSAEESENFGRNYAITELRNYEVTELGKYRITESWTDGQTDVEFEIIF